MCRLINIASSAVAADVQETHAKDQFTGVLVNSEQKMKMTNGDQLYNSCKYYKTKSKTNTGNASSY